VAEQGPPERDAAAEAGRAAGRAASALGRRLLGIGFVREAIRRGVEAAKEPEPDPPPEPEGEGA
jgi:hypothetical protein